MNSGQEFVLVRQESVQLPDLIAEGYKAQLAAEVKDFNARERMDVKSS